MQDPSPIIRQAVAVHLGARVNSQPVLIQPLINIMETDSEPAVRQIAEFSLLSVESPEMEPIKTAIRKNIPDVVVLIPGVDDSLGFDTMTRRDSILDESIWSSWRLRHILEAGGVKIIEHKWEGNRFVESFREAQLNLDETLKEALSFSQTGKVGIIPYSGGNYIAERLFESNLNPKVKEALAANKIHIISIGNPSLLNFSLLDPGWVNIWSFSDPISWLSIAPWPKNYDLYLNNVSHFAYENSRAISRISYEMFGWKYTPYSGSWQGSYNFNSFSPPDYFRQAGNINVAPSLDLMQQLRAPDLYYLQPNQFQPLTSLPQNFEYTPDIQIYAPLFDSRPDGSRTYEFVPVAPPDFYLQDDHSKYLTPSYMQQFPAPNNYYLSPAATMPQIQQPSITMPGFK